MSNLRLDLPRYCCSRLQLSGTFSEPKKGHDEFLSFLRQPKGRLTELENQDQPRAHFGSIYRISETDMIVIAIVEWAQDLSVDYRMTVVVEERESSVINFPMPSPYLRSVSRLLQGADEHFNLIDGTCTARFAYHAAQGFRSRISLPHPLLVPGLPPGFDHVEAVELSRRTDDQTEYSLMLGQEKDAVLHFVEFPTQFELSQTSVRSKLLRAVEISSQLISKNEEVADA